MSLSIDLADRPAAMNIDEATRARLRELRPLVAEQIDAAIDAAYQQILKSPEVQRIYRNVSLEEGKRSQRQHWLDDIFAGTFSEAQLAHSIAMVQARHRSGLAMRWYFTFWTVILARLLEATTRAYRRHPEKLPDMLAAMIRGVLFDIEIFTTVYVHAASDAAASELNTHAASFEREISALVKSVAGSTMQLNDTARSMSSSAEQTTNQVCTAVAVGETTAGNAASVATTTEHLALSIQDIGQRVATQEIAQQVQQVAQSSGTAISSMAAVNTSAVQTGEAAKQVQTGASALIRELEQLSIQVDQFLAKIRKAA